MNKIDYNEIFEKEIAGAGRGKKLLLHACCAPCSTAVLDRVAGVFDVTLFFYNPNIDSLLEYERRAAELVKLKSKFDVRIIIPKFDSAPFLKASEGYESEREGGARCGKCFHLRLDETAKAAKERGFDYFCSTLSLSPHKNSAVINACGEMVSKDKDIKWLYSDFKKKEGYKKSITLSQELDLYRQSYCGCKFSTQAKIV